MGLIEKGVPESIAKDFVHIYELFLVSGASASEARMKVSELFSPPRVTLELQRIQISNLVSGSTFDLITSGTSC
jgi:hypothetical protein